MLAPELNKDVPKKDYKPFVVLLAYLCVVSILGNIILSLQLYKKVSPSQQLATEVKKTEHEEMPPPIETEKADLGPDYLNLERLLLTQINSNTQASSKLFGFKFNSFHKDWDCNNRNMKFTSRGIVVSCNQKPCSLSQGLLYPDNIMQQRSAECSEELASRDFSEGQLPRLTINVEKLVADEEPSFDTNAKTPKGRAYKLEEVLGKKYETGYTKQFKVTFYSPKELTNMLSNLGGTFYGSDYVYAKYSTDVGIYESANESTQITEEKITVLLEKMIDSIDFTEPLEF